MAWAFETEDPEPRRRWFSLWAVNDTDLRGGWGSGESGGAGRAGAAPGAEPCGDRHREGGPRLCTGHQVSGGGGTFHSPPDISGGCPPAAWKLRPKSSGSPGEGVGPLWAEGAAGTWQWGGERKRGAQGDPEFPATADTACSGRGAPGAGQLSPWTVPAARAPFLPEACEAALGPGSVPVLPGTGVPRLPPEQSSLPLQGRPGPGPNTWVCPNLGPEQRGPGVGGPLPLAQGALLRHQRRCFLLCRPRGQAPSHQQDRGGKRAAFSLPVPSPPGRQWADPLGQTPAQQLPAGPGQYPFLRDQSRQPGCREDTLGRWERGGAEWGGAGGHQGRPLAPPAQGTVLLPRAPGTRVPAVALTSAPAEGHKGGGPRPWTARPAPFV